MPPLWATRTRTGPEVPGRCVNPGFALTQECAIALHEEIVAPEIDPDGRQKLSGDINSHAPERIQPLIQEFYAGLTGS